MKSGFNLFSPCLLIAAILVPAPLNQIRAAETAAEGTYEITVIRGAGTEGTLSCPAAGISKEECYWRKEKRIPAGVYKGCSTTIMASKKYKAVFIPNVSGFKEVFIHQGSKPEHSDGCIVVAQSVIEKLWDKVPRDAKNITVKIVDE